MPKKNTSAGMVDNIKPIFKERFLEMLTSEEEYEKFIQVILTPQRKSFRVNTIKETDPKKLVRILKEKGVEVEQVPWDKNSFYVIYDKEKRTDLGNLFEHFLGKIYVQEATSMLPPLLLEIPEEIDNNFRVLDMAAAPGSKTTQLGELMKNKGVLVANELDYSRLGPLKANLERSGLTNVIITNEDGRRIKGVEIYDRVLLDTPCSGSGVIRKSPGTLKAYNPKKLKGIRKLQLHLMDKAFELLKPEGIMTYSTCSLDPEENEFNIKDFLEKHNNAQLLQAELPGIQLTNKLTSFQEETIPKDITEKTIRVWPQDNDTNGFFVAKIKKIS